MRGHTPGPWKRGCVGSDAYWVGPDWDRPLVARIERDRDESDADARLIASAPDLLAALKSLLDYDVQDAGCLPTDAHLDAQNDARAAIAKAEGR